MCNWEVGFTLLQKRPIFNPVRKEPRANDKQQDEKNSQ